ncbi:translational activator of cytochrome c oxidase [Trichuris trichiura]|uniref:Translational activator of cytochrome c oxidase n=1 Tax=Trichuris trichiura TaxID=36087 RepID=A0A077Z3C2_TRITR|nr:translational activator of cytochrome c oxidase [Trichuris trichiura]
MKFCSDFCRVLFRLHCCKNGSVLALPRITQVIATRQKGHSKWQNIRHTKEANDLQRQRIFTKLAYKIGVAIRANSMQTDPRLNRDLERLLQECSDNNMPKLTIQKAIDRAVNKPMRTVYFDVKGPGGSLFIVEAMTESEVQTKNQLKKHFNKIGGFTFADQGIRMFFKEKGIVSVVQSPVNTERGSKKTANPNPLYSLSLEEAVNVAIDVGAEEVEESVEEDDQQIVKFLCDPMEIQRVCKELANRGYVIKSSENEYLCVNTIKLDDKYKQQVDLFFEAVHSMESINRVFDNTE